MLACALFLDMLVSTCRGNRIENRKQNPRYYETGQGETNWTIYRGGVVGSPLLPYKKISSLKARH